MTLEELGAALREERQKRLIDIDDAANRLKISARQLRALEEGDASSLPPPAYAKGFLRSYAAYVGFSAEEINEALRSLSSVEQPVTPRSVYQPEPDTAPRTKRTPLLFLFVIGLLIAGGYVAWQQGFFALFTQQQRTMVQPAAKHDAQHSVSVASQKTPVEDASVPVKNETRQAAPASSPVPSAGTPPLPPVALPSQSAAVPPSSERVQPQPVEPVSPVSGTQTAVSVDAPHKVIITAVEECWVHSSADKTDTRQFSLHKGDTFALTFTTNLELKLGNAGGVHLRYDGVDVPPVGRSGQVRTITFPPAPAGVR
ncbi:MAG: helix-turn-helix domain-containing protein [Desulfovibrio sp.]|nr:helix-turn-helix domain-containing protein [Desulfovibrio sp.]